jgi:anaerobic selenocysteine-containing dehydrogenase
MWQPTACILCECNCGLEVEIEDQHFVRLRGDKQHPASRGYACEKAHRLDHYQHAKDRLKTPLRRKSDGTFEEIDWDTAIREVADRLAKVRDQFGGDAIFYYGGGGQGNHLPGAYATATRRALGSRHRSSALAQEKTGEFWVTDRMYGNGMRADFEHCDVALFIGKNPWHSHSIPRARVTLKEIANDPARTLIVIDPRRTETAEIADIHLQVKPGADAFLLSAMLAILVENDWIDRAFLTRANGLDSILEALRKIPIAEYCAHAGIEESLVRSCAEKIGKARALSSFEDLGVQMNAHSTLVSYLHHLIVALTGSIGKAGTHYVPTGLVQLFGGESKFKSPVTGAPVIAGMIPCNVIPDEILTDHPKRYRAMIVEAANPAHSLADSKRMREALRALDTLVVIDVAMSETARLADYVLPASSQFEKAEATFFNLEFPRNYFHLRKRLFPRPEGPLPEAEIHARLVEALGVVGENDYAPLREAAKAGLAAYAQALMTQVLPDPRLQPQAPILLYRTLPLADEVKEGAVIFGIVLRGALQHLASFQRAGFSGNPLEAAVSLFEAICNQPSGVVFSVDEWPETFSRIKKIELFLPDLADELSRLSPPVEDAQFPYVLSAGERRSFTANTILRDPGWRKKDPGGALRISLADAQNLGVSTGDSVRLVTRRDSVVVAVEVSDSMQRGHLSLPNGLGLDYPSNGVTGVAPNELTRSEDRDPFVGTPWHKRVPARVERL